MSKNFFFKKIIFNEEFRCFKAGEIFEFRPGINLLVGDQGCGKSSMFHVIMKFGQYNIDAEYDESSNYTFLDTESMNPRLKNSWEAHRDFKTVTEYNKAEFDHALDTFAYDYKYKSHGQIMLPLMLAQKKIKRKTILIDEPEAGLSIRSQYKVLEHYKELSKNNQLIIATHSLPIISEIGEVLSLEDKKWMTSNEFILTQKNKNDNKEK